MFVLKKIVGHLLMPFPLGLGLVVLGLLFIVFRRRVRGWLVLLAGVLVLAVSGNRAVSIAITSSLEKAYPPAPALPSAPPGPPPTDAAPEVEAGDQTPATAPDVEAAPAAPASRDTDRAPVPEPLRETAFVVVLGSGHGNATDLPAGQRLSPSARARLTEGLRLAIALPESWLVVSGPRVDVYQPGDDDTTHARMVADAAVELGFPRERIVEIDTARDTAEEIDSVKLLVGDERVALVTSAFHMPRTMELAGAAGLAAFPCPADYLGARDARVGKLAYVTWDAESLQNTTRAWREYIGRAWAAIVAWWRD